MDERRDENALVLMAPAMAVFAKLMNGRTSFIVAHRLSTIRSADKIVAMKDGKIMEIGTHEELIRKNGFYHDLYMSQYR